MEGQVLGRASGTKRPDWWIEGLAMTCEERFQDRSDQAVLDIRGKGLVWVNGYSKQNVLTSSFQHQDSTLVGMNSRTAFFMVQHLVKKHGAKIIPALLQKIRADTPFADAIQELCGVTEEQLYDQVVPALKQRVGVQLFRAANPVGATQELQVCKRCRTTRCG